MSEDEMTGTGCQQAAGLQPEITCACVGLGAVGCLNRDEPFPNQAAKRQGQDCTLASVAHFFRNLDAVVPIGFIQLVEHRKDLRRNRDDDLIHKLARKIG